MRFVQSIIDILRHKKILEIKIVNNPIFQWQKLTKKQIKKLQNKLKTDKKLKVAFLHMYATDTQEYAIFEWMLKSEIFDPYWIVNPDVSRSKENFDYQYKRTKDTLIFKYGKERVLDGYKYDGNQFIDYSDEFDLATTTNPYEIMAHKFFQIEYWSKKLPMFYISYFYMGRCFVSIENIKSPQFSCFWKVFVENSYVIKLAKKYQAIRGKNMVVVGYSKMDALNDIKIIPRLNKRIILAPHHSIGEEELECGAFLFYCNDLIELPRIYHDIEFIYRPHPLLEERLNNLWGKEKTQEWLKKMLSYSNVVYSTEGEYLDLFANSDALIHDCGSFMAEYLFTGHPCAYMKCKTANYKKIHTKFGNKCANVHYQIENRQDLFDFIDNVVINGHDEKKKDRENFAKSEIMINYPNVTKDIMKMLTQEIKGK